MSPALVLEMKLHWLQKPPTIPLISLEPHPTLLELHCHEHSLQLGDWPLPTSCRGVFIFTEADNLQQPGEIFGGEQ